jgi:TonB family protein
MVEMANKAKGSRDPFVEKFEVESDARLFRFLGVFVLVGAALMSYMMTVTVVVPGIVTQHIKKETETKVTIDFDKMQKDKEKEKKKEEKKKEGPPKTHEGGGRAHGRGTPKALATQAALKLITSKSSATSLSSYTLLGSKFTKDIDKVLNSVSGLTKTGQTRLGGRPGMATGGDWNGGYAASGSGGVDDMLGGLWGGGGGIGGLKAKGSFKAPSASDIDFGEAGGQRSTESIISVIRQHTPGLRHTFEKYLKMQPGFRGKVTMRLTIAPSGNVIEAAIVSSTTGNDAFDQEIREKVKTWRFEPIKGKGNDGVTVPFNFSE